jgi:hypothetical protein
MAPSASSAVLGGAPSRTFDLLASVCAMAAAAAGIAYAVPAARARRPEAGLRRAVPAPPARDGRCHLPDARRMPRKR